MQFVKDVRDDFSRVGWAALITPVFVLIAVGVVWWVLWSMMSGAEEDRDQAFDRARETQILACERGNELRSAVNTNIAVLESFLLEASDVRQAASLQGDDAAQSLIDERAARRYRELVQGLEVLEIADCEEVIPEYLSEQ